jgi:peptidoglycan/xylan/chitin deacetylase (PgdA/CDA1 family)
MLGIRADRLATLYLFHPLQRLARSGTAAVPILMYHSISTADESRSHPYYRTVTSVEVFEDHVKYLRENGYKAASLSDAVRLTQGPAEEAEKRFVMTFDDGFQDFYTEAFPILSKYGYTATVFLPTAYVGDTARRFNGTECLTWRQIRELQTAGVDFGSHTVSHPQLRDLGTEKVQDEIRSSKEAIEQELGCAVTSFAYPYAFPETDGAFQNRLRENLLEAGYQNGVSTIIGRASRNDDMFFMKRVPVNSSDDGRLFRAKLEGGYDWLHKIQHASKILRPGAGRRTGFQRCK